MFFECFHELYDNFIFSPFSRSNIRVHLGVVFSFELFKVHSSVLVDVNCFESAFNQIQPELVHVPHNNSDELVKTNLSTAINIQRFEQSLNVNWVDFHTEIVDSLRELWQVEIARTIIISYFELSL